MQACADFVYAGLGSDPCVDLLHRLTGRLATRDVGLIGNNNEHVTGRVEPAARVDCVAHQTEVGRRSRRMADALGVDPDFVEHAVAVQEDRPAPHVADSHFINATRNSG